MKTVSPYQLLANAIIRQAAIDYMQLLCGEKVRCASINECERFFNSDYFMLLTEFYGPSLMNMIKKYAEKNDYDWKNIRKKIDISQIKMLAQDLHCL